VLVCALGAFGALSAIGCGGEAAAPARAPSSVAPAGGSAPAAYPPSSPSSPSSTARENAPARPGAVPAPEAAPKTDMTPSTAGAARADSLRDPSLHRAVEAAQRELDLAGSDCVAACRALGSMERATARLCTLEEASCEDVRQRLLRSRERVRASCGGCPGGPSVNPDAPIPSR
jgi:hypothetical protein